MTCFVYSQVIKGLICLSFAVPLLFAPKFLIWFFFKTTDESSSWNKMDLFFMRWFGKYIFDFGFTFFLSAYVIKDAATRKKWSLGMAFTQIVGLIFTSSHLYYPTLDGFPLKDMRLIAWIIPVGYCGLILMFLGTWLCTCEKCTPKKKKKEN